VSKTRLCSDGRSRRHFLADTSMGLTGLALGTMLPQRALANEEKWTAPDGQPHFAPKAKRVIWLFMLGGVSHVESFDPKPGLNKFAGKQLSETPMREVLTNAFVKENLKAFVPGQHQTKMTLYPMQSGFRERGKNGVAVSDWFPHIGSQMHEVSLIRSVWTTDNDHGAILQFHTGRHIFDGYLPTLGSWAHYGLGSLNENLPSFVVLGQGPGDCCGGVGTHGSGYLGPEHAGVKLEVDPKNPLPFSTPGPGMYREEQLKEFELLGRLNRLSAVEYPSDPALKARIKSYELAYRMQMAAPEAIEYKAESEETKRLYGIDQEHSKPFGEVCLAARRLSERGVRFVQVYHGGAGNAWDAHQDLKKSYGDLAAQTDKPVAGLLQDLKQRGLLDETLVVWATEFGRSPGAERSNGRDHHPYGFSIWMAGGGIKAGTVHGSTDEIGFHAVEHRHYVTDIHATVLHQLGIDPKRLDVPGRKRIEIDYGKPIREIIA